MPVVKSKSNCPLDIYTQLGYKFTTIDNAKRLDDLKVPPKNHLTLGAIMAKFIEAPTIGEILNEEFLVPLGLSAYKLAQEIKTYAYA